MEYLLLALSVAANLTLLVVCIASLNHMTSETHHLARIAVVAMTVGATYSLLTSHPGDSCWTTPIGALLYLLAERRGYMPRIFGLGKEERRNVHLQ